MLAPIVLFVYNRPKHALATLESIMHNHLADQSDLYIYSDGCKENSSNEQMDSIKEVRQIIRKIKWCKTVTIIESDDNKGLAQSVITGVTEIVNKFGKVIVLEDDLILSKGFLKYMNNALDFYENEKQVSCISGYMYPIQKQSQETFFLRSVESWSWATWKRGWELFETDGEKLLQELKDKKLTDRFDFEGAYPYTKMLSDQIERKNNSWAIRWYASVFLKNGLCLYPTTSLIRNIGHDSSGIHCMEETAYANQEITKKINVLPIKIKESLPARRLIKRFFRQQNSQTNLDKIKKRMYSVYLKMFTSHATTN